jgi:hypothetical protein
MRDGPDLYTLEDDFEKAVVLFSKSALFVVFHTECFDNPISGDGLVEKGGDGAHSLLTLPTEFSKPLSKFLNGKDGQRKDEESDDRQFPIAIEDDTGQSEDGKGVLEKAGDCIGDRSLDEVHIIGDPGDEDARGRFGKEGEGKALKVVVEFLSHIGYNPQTDKVHQVRLAVVEDSLEEKEHHDGDGQQEKHLPILFEKYIIQGWLHKECLGCCQERDEDHTDHGKA